MFDYHLKGAIMEDVQLGGLRPRPRENRMLRLQKTIYGLYMVYIWFIYDLCMVYTRVDDCEIRIIS